MDTTDTTRLPQAGWIPPYFAHSPAVTPLSNIGIGPDTQAIADYRQPMTTEYVIGCIGVGPYVALNSKCYTNLMSHISTIREHMDAIMAEINYATSPDGPYGPIAGTEMTYQAHAEPTVAPGNPRKRVRAACTNCHSARKTCGESRPCARCYEKGMLCENRPRKKPRAKIDQRSVPGDVGWSEPNLCSVAWI
ncbi:hypothetical protein BD309DRAFT_966998 [Dichomitus squalens]|uniref:Transcription activator of gluconeogenesis ERT1 n=1 Tax=Dichomitus squalens TaxID=114155 RepID=A0A4Q9MHQ8_9APHY|nr:hypothetical protein BD311DRAFT_764623 [Dichomitus squalens]TBU40652.1 hypothetical protein BD309DRAFT_966998 [Dichomitus squalens]TBU60202.1 hypothetical protein BD310DRAFT_923542 [Dichomitus squalens]